MKKIIFFGILSISLITLLVNVNSISTQKKYVSPDEYVPNEVLVKFKKDVSKNIIQDAINSLQGKIITYLGK